MTTSRTRLAAVPVFAAALLACSGGLSGVRACPPDVSQPVPVGPWGKPDIGRVEPCAEPVIQLAILLDTSGSMEGLINQARSRIWDVVNDLTKARRDGHRARLEVALYQYGSGVLPSSEGFLTLVQPFTTDLDLLSERLFSLSVGGSAEYCGWVMQSALNELSWDQTAASKPLKEQPLRVVVIAGNEPFTQGPVSYRAPTGCARGRGVIINTVYCGRADEGRETGWYDGAVLGCGEYLSIDHNRAIRYVSCPQDAELLRLNSSLNTTYVPYGGKGEAFKDRQRAQDAANYAVSTEGAVARAAAKSSEAYSNAHWDLVDAVKQKKADVATVPTEELPESMRGMTVDERKEEISKLTQERDTLKDRIRDLAAERERFLKDHRDRDGRGETLDSAMIRAIRGQAGRLGFRFEVD